MKNTYLFSYNQRSLGSKAISGALGINRIRPIGSSFVGSPEKTVIVWGSPESLSDEILKCRLLNPPERTLLCVNKLKFFGELHKEGSTRIPRFTTDTEQALRWISEGVPMLGRLKLEGMSGDGIVFFTNETGPDEAWLSAKMYVEYIKKMHEFRVHVAFGKIIDIQKKVLRKHDQNGAPIDPATVDFRIRNIKNGFIFQRHNIEVPADVKEQALNAFRASRLDFGAFDVIYNKSQNKAYVLEVNTAPGLEGTTIENYAAAFKEYLNSE
jgi:hypothetical protein